MARTVLFAALTLVYPLGVWWLRGSVAPRQLAIGLAVVGALRLASSSEARWRLLGLGAFVLAAIAALTNAEWPLKWYPVAVNVFLLGVFVMSLTSPPSLVERLARLKEPALPPEAVAYTRRVTQVWCGFFVVNGSLAAVTALVGTPAQWALYNGVVSYGLMGLLAAIEYAVRRRLQSRIRMQSRSQELARD